MTSHSNYEGLTPPHVVAELRSIIAELSELVHVPESGFDADVLTVLHNVRMVLRVKNRAYGNSALEPVRIFSQAGPDEQIRARIDDKLSRIKHGVASDNEDTVLDLIGYLVLLRIAQGKV